MAAKKNALLLFVFAAIFASSAALASILRSTLSDSKQIAHQTSALGAPTKYTDQVSQETNVTDKDVIGRRFPSPVGGAASSRLSIGRQLSPPDSFPLTARSAGGSRASLYPIRTSSKQY